MLDGRQEVLGTHLLEFPRVLKLRENRPVSQDVLHLRACEVNPVLIKLDGVQLLGQLDQPLIHLVEEYHEDAAQLLPILQILLQTLVNLHAIQFLQPREIPEKEGLIIGVAIDVVAFDCQAVQLRRVLYPGKLLDVLELIVREREMSQIGECFNAFECAQMVM